MHPSACASPAGAATVADIEGRILEPCPSLQAPALRAARRRFLELRELLLASQSHGGPKTQRDLLIGQARELRLPPNGESLDEGIARLDTHGTAPPASSSICALIEDKHATVTRLPGLTLLAARVQERDGKSAQEHGVKSAQEHGVKSAQEHGVMNARESDVVSAQAALLSTHAQCIGELANEAELLAALSRHAADHPILDVARGLERYFGGLIDSLSLKLQIIAAEMHHTLYSPEVLQAAGRLRRILRAREAELAKEQGVLDERLAIYRDAGSEFQEIAAAYSAVLRDTDQIRCDIARVSQL